MGYHILVGQLGSYCTNHKPPGTVPKTSLLSKPNAKPSPAKPTPPTKPPPKRSRDTRKRSATKPAAPLTRSRRNQSESPEPEPPKKAKPTPPKTQLPTTPACTSPECKLQATCAFPRSIPDRCADHAGDRVWAADGWCANPDCGQPATFQDTSTKLHYCNKHSQTYTVNRIRQACSKTGCRNTATQTSPSDNPGESRKAWCLIHLPISV
jgi:hypothetical protein